MVSQVNANAGNGVRGAVSPEPAQVGGAVGVDASSIAPSTVQNASLTGAAGQSLNGDQVPLSPTLDEAGKRSFNLLLLPPEMRQQKLQSEPLDAQEFSSIADTCSALKSDVEYVISRMSDSEKSRLWFQACGDNQASGVKFLVAIGFDVHAIDAHDRTAMQVAARSGHVETVKVLLETGVDSIGTTTTDGRPGGSRHLNYAAYNGDAASVRTMILAGANVNTMVRRGETTLWKAVEHGRRPEVVGLLLEAGCDVNAASSYDGTTPLWNAVRNRSTAIVQMLLEHPGIRIKTPDFKGDTPIDIARSYRDYDKRTPKLLELFDRFEVARSHPESKQWTKAAVAGDTGTLRRLVEEHGARHANCVSSWGASALWYAAAHGHAETVSQLIEWGADPAWHDGDGDTALNAAAWNEHPDTIRVLIKQGADPNVLNRGGDTPLYDAAIKGRMGVVVALLEGGADPNIVVKSRKEGFTALHMATIHERVETVDTLLEAGADAHHADRDGITPKMKARSEAMLAVYEWHSQRQPQMTS